MSTFKKYNERRIEQKSGLTTVLSTCQKLL